MADENEEAEGYAENEEISEAFRLRLERAIDKSFRDMDSLKDDRQLLLKEYNTCINNEDKTVINKLFQMIDTYQRLLSSGEPKSLVSTTQQSLKPTAETLRLAINHLVKEINFSRNLNRVVLDALVGWGIMKTGMGKHPYKNLEIEGEFFDPGQPFSKPVSIRHFVIDTAASELDQIDFIGDRYSQRSSQGW